MSFIYIDVGLHAIYAPERQEQQQEAEACESALPLHRCPNIDAPACCRAGGCGAYGGVCGRQLTALSTGRESCSTAEPWCVGALLRCVVPWSEDGVNSLSAWLMLRQVVGPVGEEQAEQASAAPSMYMYGCRPGAAYGLERIAVFKMMSCMGHDLC